LDTAGIGGEPVEIFGGLRRAPSPPFGKVKDRLWAEAETDGGAGQGGQRAAGGAGNGSDIRPNAAVGRRWFVVAVRCCVRPEVH